MNVSIEMKSKPRLDKFQRRKLVKLLRLRRRRDWRRKNWDKILSPQYLN